ncbi:MAG: SpoIVB peptidase S55 domain-containing protein [bacterium]
MKGKFMKWKAFALALAALAAWSVPGEAAGELVLPGGELVGIRLAGTGVVVTELREASPAAEAGVRAGDEIRAVDGAPVESAAELAERVQRAGEQLTLEVLRGGEALTLTVKPRIIENSPSLGLWVRDSLAGVGTVTFINPETGQFGALGHAAGEPGGEKGEVFPATVGGVKVGKAGDPGALEGHFAGEEPIGEIEKNTALGLFGTLSALPEAEPIPVAARTEIHPGKVTILSQAGGTVERYEGEILRLLDGSTPGRSLMLRITDTRLLALTGGIVQGMSGSPILQEGKLVGAVTHVLIDDPTRGYGITAEEMLEEASRGEKLAA